MKRIEWVTLLGTLLMAGCGEGAPVPQGVRMDITVRNTSTKNIYVVVHSGERHEDFGVVGINSGKTIGFGLGHVGQTVSVEWSVGDPDAQKHSATMALPAPVNYEVTLTNLADGSWTTMPPPPQKP